MGRLARLTEKGFIHEAAVLPASQGLHTLLTTDLLTDGIHFRSAWTPGALLGRKVLAVNLSDIAAMGGVPGAFVFSAGFPRSTDPRYALDVARGLASQARRFGAVLVGGDTCASRTLVVSVTL